MRETLQISVRDGQYREMLARYHFAPRDLAQLRQVGALALQAAKPRLYWEPLPARDESGTELAAVVTLGGGIDELQDSFQQRERLTESYMAECVDAELLRTAYERAAERIHAHTGKWVSAFRFLGDREPLARMEEIFRLLAPDGVSYNGAYMLTPKKTVVFLASLGGERRESYCRVCTDCGNLSCRDREEPEKAARGQDNLTYGYQRIFGERKRE